MYLRSQYILNFILYLAHEPTSLLRNKITILKCYLEMGKRYRP